MARVESRIRDGGSHGHDWGFTAPADRAEGWSSGRLIPAQPTEIEICFGDQSLAVTADELGRFTVTSVGSGPIRLRFRPGGLAPAQVVTEWIFG